METYISRQKGYCYKTDILIPVVVTKVDAKKGKALKIGYI